MILHAKKKAVENEDGIKMKKILLKNSISYDDVLTEL